MRRWAAMTIAAIVLALATGASTCQAPQEPAATPTPTPTAAAMPTPGPRATPARVVRAIDGDTIEVVSGGRLYIVRYIGIDAPEAADPRRPAQCYGQEAWRRNRELVEGKTVLLEKDVSETDRYGRLLRHVWADGAFVGAVLVQEGYARAATVPPDVRYAHLFARLEQEARQAGRGLWSACLTSGRPTG